MFKQNKTAILRIAALIFILSLFTLTIFETSHDTAQSAHVIPVLDTGIYHKKPSNKKC